jgi:hypothetical protein
VLFGLRLPERLALWLSAALSWLLRIDPIFEQEQEQVRRL